MHKTLTYLKNECNAHVHYLNGTHPYVATSESSQVSPIESQRVWYNATDDSSVYTGIEESIAHVLHHVKLNGPYEGIIGFSQGSILASLIIKQQPSLFKYFVSISGFCARSDKYKTYYSPNEPLDVASLHIYGRRDTLVDPSRSQDFAKCFRDSACVEHEAGHFAPDAWPIYKLAEFINAQAIHLKSCSLQAGQTFEYNLVQLDDALIRANLADLDNAESGLGN